MKAPRTSPNDGKQALTPPSTPELFSNFSCRKKLKRSVYNFLNWLSWSWNSETFMHKPITKKGVTTKSSLARQSGQGTYQRQVKVSRSAVRRSRCSPTTNTSVRTERTGKIEFRYSIQVHLNIPNMLVKSIWRVLS